MLRCGFGRTLVLGGASGLVALGCQSGEPTGSSEESGGDELASVEQALACRTVILEASKTPGGTFDDEEALAPVLTFALPPTIESIGPAAHPKLIFTYRVGTVEQTCRYKRVGAPHGPTTYSHKDCSSGAEPGDEIGGANFVQLGVDNGGSSQGSTTVRMTLVESPPCGEVNLCEGVVIDDDNLCSADSCDPTTGVVSHTPLPGVSCPNDTLCDGNETCNETGVCSAGSPVVIEDFNTCTFDACDPTTGAVSHTPTPGSACDDGDACSTDSCDGAGVCIGVPIAVPSDDNDCTEDSCDIETGSFEYTPLDGSACDDMNPCSGAGTCNAAAECEPGDPTPADGDPSTLELCTASGIISYPASDVDATITSTLDATLAFLHSGANPIQTGVTAGAIDELRAAAIVGHVLGPDGEPLSGATVRVVGHPELGVTRSELDGGRFVLAVNGGAALTVAIESEGFLPSQRSVDDVPFQSFLDVGNVVLVEPDENATVIELDTITDVTTAAGGIVSDADGTRQAIVMFSPGTSALLEFADGTTQPADTLTLRITEYTQGSFAVDRMPANLPLSSAFTFAVELSADEAIAAGASSILLDQSVSVFLDNFLDFPVGSAIPVGTLDRVRGLWVPNPDGVVLEILDVAGGIAAVDVTGDGVSEDDATLESYGLSIAEREDLALRYAPGTTLWHAELDHFTPCDFNAAPNLPPDGCVPLQCGLGNPPFKPDPQPDPDPPNQCGSVIGCTTQTLGESVPIAGTGHALHYRSDRTQGGTPRSVTFPISGPSLPASLIAIRARLRVAGQVIEELRTCPCATDDSVTLEWGGRDLFGRQLAGLQPAIVEIAYEYPSNYAAGSPVLGVVEFARMFGTWTGVDLNILSRNSTELIRRESIHIGGLYNGSHALGGFSFDSVHAYDVLGGTLYRGDGTERRRDEFVTEFQQLRTAPSGGFTSIATMANGDLLYSHAAGRRVRRVAEDGTETLIASSDAGTCQPGDSAPALGSCLINAISKLTPAPDGSIYARSGGQIVRIVPGGNATRIAGVQGGGSTAEGILATQASLPFITAIALAPDGSVYVGESSKIRRISTDGTIRTVAGGFATNAPEGNGGHASLAAFGFGPQDIAFAPDGSLYVLHSVIGNVHHVRRIRADGIVEPVAGYGSTFDQSGLAALDAMNARIIGATQLAVDREGTVYFNETLRIQSSSAINAIRAISGDGKIRTVAGANSFCAPGDLACGLGGSAVAAGIGQATDLHTAPDGTVRAFNGQFAHAVLPDLPPHGRDTFLVAETDGRTVYRFDASGRHLESLDAETLAVIHTMAYDAEGRLVSVTDVDNLATTIQRDAFGEPTAIVGPYGHTTSLTIDADGFLGQIEDPTGEAWSATYQSDGLMESWTNRDGHTSNFQWGPLGRLIQHQHPGGGFMTLARTDTATGHQVTITSPLGRATTYKREHDAAGTESRLTTLPTGLSPASLRRSNGTQTTTLPDGTVIGRILDSDDRWGMESPVPTRTVTQLPSLLSRVVETSRSFTPTNFVDPLLIQEHTETRTINGRTWTTSYNVASRVQTTTSPEGRITRNTLDTRGRVIKVERPDVFDVNYLLDADGRISTITQGTRVSGRGYGTDGLVNIMTDALSQQTTYARNARGDVLTETRPDLEVTAFGYNGEGMTTQVTPPATPTHGMTFNSIGQLGAYDPPNLGFPDVTSYSYDLDKKLELVTQPGPRLISYDYDAAGRLDEINFPNGIISRTYSPTTGQLTEIDGPDGVTLGMSYDGSLLKSLTWSGDVAGTVAWTHDTDFRVVNETVNGGFPAAFSYDDDSLLTAADGLTLVRDVESGRVNAATSGGVTETFTYNAYGEVEAKTSSYSGVPFLELAYVRDDLGRITEKIETLGVVTTVSVFDYDAAGRLLTVVEDGTLTESYSYDPNGNRTSALNASGVFGAAYDDQDRIIGYGSNLLYEFSDAGDLVSREDVTTSEVTAYDYDAVGNLRSVTLPNGDVIEYLVDGRGRRVGKTVNGVFEKGWLWRGALQPVAELDSTGAVAKRFVYAGGMNVPALMVTSTATYRVVTDHLGSVRLVIDVATGAVAQELAYDVWGRVLVDTNPGLQPFGFAGGLYDAETGLVRFGARDYDAEIGRWTAKDPIRFGGGINLYAFVADDPINRTDAEGLSIDGEDPPVYPGCDPLLKPCFILCNINRDRCLENDPEGRPPSTCWLNWTLCRIDCITNFCGKDDDKPSPDPNTCEPDGGM